MKKVLFVLMILLSFACSKKIEHKEIQLPYTPILSSGSSWGVVISNYVRVKEDPSDSSTMLTSLTKGSIVEVLFLSRTIELGVTVSWYHINIEGLRGWILKDDLDVFESKEQAVNFAGDIE